jgi:hypothetical protein
MTPVAEKCLPVFAKKGFEIAVIATLSILIARYYNDL